MGGRPDSGAEANGHAPGCAAAHELVGQRHIQHREGVLSAIGRGSRVLLQAEYFVPRRHAVEAMLAIQCMGARIGPHLFISEIRTIDADTLWMSPCYKQPSVALHFTWKQDWPALAPVRTGSCIGSGESTASAKPRDGLRTCRACKGLCCARSEASVPARNSGATMRSYEAPSRVLRWPPR
jgi:hypothetical protein